MPEVYAEELTEVSEFRSLQQPGASGPRSLPLAQSRQHHSLESCHYIDHIDERITGVDLEIHAMAGNEEEIMSISLSTTTMQGMSTSPHAIASLMGSGCPIIGYFGAFARWFDYETVRRVAVSRPEYSWLLIGWDYAASSASDFEEVENIHVIGPISYELPPAYAKHFSVSTIPFLINDITLSTSPIKLFEYMALGHPIVTTSLPECR